MHRLSVSGVIVTVLVLMSLATGQDVPRNMLDGSSVRSRAEAIVPQFIHYDGSIPETAVTQSGAIGMAFAIYDATEGSAPLWIETQNVVVDSSHHYSVVLGNARASGIPSDLFATGEPRWLGVTLEG